MKRQLNFFIFVYHDFNKHIVTVLHFCYYSGLLYPIFVSMFHIKTHTHKGFLKQNCINFIYHFSFLLLKAIVNIYFKRLLNIKSWTRVIGFLIWYDYKKTHCISVEFLMFVDYFICYFLSGWFNIQSFTHNFLLNCWEWFD